MTPLDASALVFITGILCLAIGYVRGRIDGFKRGVAHGMSEAAHIVEEHSANRRLRRAFKSKLQKKKKVPK